MVISINNFSSHFLPPDLWEVWKLTGEIGALGFPLQNFSGSGFLKIEDPYEHLFGIYLRGW